MTQTLQDTMEEEPKQDNEVHYSCRYFCKTYGFKKSVTLVLKNLTIEPAVFLSSFAIFISIIPTTYVFFDKVCRLDLGHSEEHCQEILYNNTFFDRKQELQSKTTIWMMISMAVGLLPTVIVKMLAGSWSDKHGRKPILYMIIIGVILRQASLLVIDYYKEAEVKWIILANLITELLNSSALIPVSVSYISDISSKRSRTFRILLLELCFFVGLLCGNISGGPINDKYGYQSVCIFSMALGAVALLHCMFIVKETVGTVSNSWEDRLKVLMDFINFRHVKESWMTLAKKRKGYIRFYLNLLILAALIDQLLINCGKTIFPLYTQARYDWSPTKLAKATLVINIVKGVLRSMCIGTLILRWKLPDLKVAFIGFVTVSMSYAVLAFSYKSWLFYLGSILGCIAVLPGIVIQSKLTKLVDKSEIGKVMTLRSVVGSLAGPETNIAFLAIYKETAGFFLGFTYLMTSVFYLIPLILFKILRKRPLDEGLTANSENALGEVNTTI